MQNSLSELVHYTSEIFNSKECKSSIERNKLILRVVLFG